MKLTSHFLLIMYATAIAIRPAAQAASVVLAATRPMPSKSIAESVLPGLKPYQPNHSSRPPRRRDRQIVRQHRSAAVALEPAAQPRPEDDRARQRDEAADGVNHGGTGEIMEAGSQPRQEIAGAAHGRQKAIRPPGPVPDDRVDETGNRDAVQQIADEAGAADHRARGDGGAGIGKRELEEPERQEGHAGGLISRRRVLAGRTS